MNEDIKKGFLQIKLQVQDQSLLQFLSVGRFFCGKCGQFLSVGRIFQQNSVVFGISCSPFVLCNSSYF